MTRVAEVEEEFGPAYPDLGAGVAKHRRLAREGLADLTREQRWAYGEAIEKAIRAKQRTELQRELPEHRCHCASGTNHSDGEAISAAVRAQHRSALLAYPAQVRRNRTPAEWQELYQAAMAEKRNGGKNGNTANQRAKRNQSGRLAHGLPDRTERRPEGHRSRVKRLAERPGLSGR